MRKITNAVQIVVTVLREIFDEASYARFLQRSQVRSSSEAYAEFWRERAQAHGRKPKCC